MPRTLWPGLPDATAPGTSISLGAVRRRYGARGMATALAVRRSVGYTVLAG